ncbi:YSIRK-type signal peptide-containing protein, partial [Mammaliicoccus sciuri]|uniref:YSIRK-type signal peptide-containing protein n=1 Tax=Mammaliicoccus sciuri TaxID=1296 RepID=UPI0039E1D5A2
MKKKKGRKMDFIPNRLNKYSIRKFTVGTASILVGATLLFGIGEEAKANEQQNNSAQSQSLNLNEDDRSNEVLEVQSSSEEQTEETPSAEETNKVETEEAPTAEETNKVETEEAPTAEETNKVETEEAPKAEETNKVETEEAP